MHLIEKKDHPVALALFRHSLHQMKLTALAEGGIEAQMWVDNAAPAVAAVLYQNKLMVASLLGPGELAGKLQPLLREQVYGQRMGGHNEALIFWDGEGAHEALLMVLGDKCPAYAVREYWELDDPARVNQSVAPEGYEILPVDGALLARGLGNTERLREEMCSERESVEEFLRHSFGVCAARDGELAGWCLSEYNCSRGCEVGIETVEGHQQKGLARAMVSALARAAAGRGLPRIGWHCFKTNVASSATARSAGFAKVLEYGELFCFFDPAVQYAVNGNFADAQGQYETAAAWYSRACAGDNAPLWAYVRHGMALVSLGRTEEALAALEAGVARGLDWWDWLNSEPRLAPLRADPRWKTLLTASSPS